MSRSIGFVTTNTTKAEQTVLEFLHINKGDQYTAQEIEEFTGIRAHLVDDIMDNLRFKGFQVCTKRGVHYFATNSWFGFLTGAGILVFMFTMLLMAWMDRWV